MESQSLTPSGSTGCSRGRGLSHLPRDAQAVVQRVTGPGEEGRGAKAWSYGLVMCQAPVMLPTEALGPLLQPAVDSTSQPAKYFLALSVCVHAQLLSHVRLFCDPANYSQPGPSVHGIFQTRILEWVTISSSRGSSRPRDRTHISCISCTGRQARYHCNIWEDDFRDPHPPQHFCGVRKCGSEGWRERPRVTLRHCSPAYPSLAMFTSATLVFAPAVLATCRDLPPC